MDVTALISAGRWRLLEADDNLGTPVSRLVRMLPNVPQDCVDAVKTALRAQGTITNPVVELGRVETGAFIVENVGDDWGPEDPLVQQSRRCHRVLQTLVRVGDQTATGSGTFDRYADNIGSTTDVEKHTAVTEALAAVAASTTGNGDGITAPTPFVKGKVLVTTNSQPRDNKKFTTEKVTATAKFVSTGWQTMTIGGEYISFIAFSNANDDEYDAITAVIKTGGALDGYKASFRVSKDDVYGLWSGTIHAQRPGVGLPGYKDIYPAVTYTTVAIERRQIYGIWKVRSVPYTHGFIQLSTSTINASGLVAAALTSACGTSAYGSSASMATVHGGAVIIGKYVVRGTPGSWSSDT